MHASTDDVGQLYRDVIASLLALSNALEKAQVLTKAQIAEAAQERLLVQVFLTGGLLGVFRSPQGGWTFRGLTIHIAQIPSRRYATRESGERGPGGLKPPGSHEGSL